MKRTLQMIIMLLALAVWVSPSLNAQYGGIRRDSGIDLTTGIFHDFLAGNAAIAAHDAVYLTTAGTVLKVPITGQTTTLLGVAPAACRANQAKCTIQITGVANVVSDAANSIGDYVGAPTTTAGRVKTLTGTIDTFTILGKRIANEGAAAGANPSSAADTITILLMPGKGQTSFDNGTSGGVPYYSATNTIGSSGVLAANKLVKGGGAGAAPADSSITDNGTIVTTTEPITFVASATGAAGENSPAGTAPTTTVAGDRWNDSTRKSLAFAPVATAKTYLSGVLYADATTVVTASNPSSIADLKTFTLPAGVSGVAGKDIRVCGGGVYTTNSAQTPTLTITYAEAGVAPIAIVSAATTGSATTMPWTSCADLITVTAGASGTVEPHGWLKMTLGTTAAAAAAEYLATNTGVSSAFDQTATVLLKMRVTLSSSDSGNSVVQRWMTVELLN